MQAQDRRISYFENIFMKNRDSNKSQVATELGACRRIMRNLAHIKHLIEIEQEENHDAPSGGDSKAHASSEKKKKKSLRSKFCPDNSQYVRYVQEIQQIEDKLLQSPLAPKN